MTQIRLIIAGGRDFNDEAHMSAAINDWFQELDSSDVTIISGMARGADMLGYRLAKANNIPVMEFPADWDTFGKSAGFIRNKEMFDVATHLIAFWDGKSKGTQNMIRLFEFGKKPFKIEKY